MYSYIVAPTSKWFTHVVPYLRTVASERDDFPFGVTSIVVVVPSETPQLLVWLRQNFVVAICILGPELGVDDYDRFPDVHVVAAFD